LDQRPLRQTLPAEVVLAVLLQVEVDMEEDLAASVLAPWAVAAVAVAEYPTRATNIR
jgi:hypothetical protein